jgi:hypothetical protein
MRDVVAHQAVQEWRKRERASCAQANEMVPLVTQLIQIYVANHVGCPKRNQALALMTHAQVLHGDLRVVGGRVPTFPSLFSDRDDYVASPIEVDLIKYREADSAA